MEYRHALGNNNASEFFPDTAKYKKPIFRFKNVMSGKYLTVANGELIQETQTDGKDQQW